MNDKLSRDEHLELLATTIYAHTVEFAQKGDIECLCTKRFASLNAHAHHVADMVMQGVWTDAVAMRAGAYGWYEGYSSGTEDMATAIENPGLGGPARINPYDPDFEIYRSTI